MAFALCPLLTKGAIGALKAHGSPDLRDAYLAPMISGRWTGTMNLTEPQAGSDRGACLAKAGLAAEVLVADGNRSEIGRVGLARFFAEKLLPVAPGLARAVASGAEPLQSYV